MYWNNRVMRRVDDAGTKYEETNLYIVEVYYHEDGSVIGWTEKDAVYASDLEGLHQSLNWMLDSLDKPVLDEAELLTQAKIARENGEEDIFPQERLSIDELLDSLGLEREDVEETRDFIGNFERDQIKQLSLWQDDGGA